MSSSRLEIKVDGPDVAANKMLKVATSTLRMLTEIETLLRKEQKAKTPPINWRVDMMSGYSYGLIAIWATGHSEAVWIEVQKLYAQQAQKQAAPAQPAQEVAK